MIETDVGVFRCDKCKIIGHAVSIEDGLICTFCELDTVVPIAKGEKLVLHKVNLEWYNG